MLLRLLRGALVGAAVGVALLGLEELANLVVDQPPLAGQELLRLLPWYLIWPALLGLLASGARDLPGRVLGTAAGVWGVVWGAIAAQELGERGLPAPSLLGFSLGAIAAVVGAVGVLRLVHCARRRWFLAVLSLAFLAPFRAVNLNAFGSPSDPDALTADAVILALALVAGLLAALAAPLLRRGALLLALLPGALAAAGTALLAPPPPTPAPASEHPDVVLVVIDTLRADRLGSYGYAGPTTPKLDALAASGLRYADATSAAPWTLPSFASLQTGREPHVHGAGVNPGDRNTQAPLGPDLPTLAEDLAAAGYRTGAIVTNPYLKRSFGLDRGYDHYDDALGLAHMMMLLHPVDLLPVRAMPDRTYRLAPRMVAAAQRWWAQTDGGPRFLMLHLMDPHKPYNAPQQDLDAVASAPAHPDPISTVYDAEIHYADRSLGPLLEQLQADGAWIIVTADHGEELSDHPGAYPDEHWPPDVRHGHTLYQEQLQVPLIVAGPGVQSQVVQRPVRNLDVVPTIRALAGTPDRDSEGQILAEALGRPIPADAPRRAQAVRYGSEKRAVLDDGLKLIRSRFGDELYDLTQDPGEQADLAERRSSDAGALANQLPGNSEGQAAELDEELLEQLRAVGYVDP